jgi:hypothetical protein
LALAMSFRVFRVPLSPPTRSLARFTLPAFFLGFHSRAFIRNRSS